MTEFLAVSWYVVPAITLAFVGLVFFIVASFHYLGAKSRGADDWAKDNAEIALLGLAVTLLGAWIWPLLIPTIILFLVFKMVVDVFPKKEK